MIFNCDKCELKNCDSSDMTPIEIHRHNEAVKIGIVPRFCEDES